MHRKVLDSMIRVSVKWIAMCGALFLIGTLNAQAQETKVNNDALDDLLAKAIIAPNSSISADPLTDGCRTMVGDTGLVHVNRVDKSLTELKAIAGPSDTRPAYGFVVPAKGTVRVRVEHPRQEDFELVMVDRRGRIQAGMLQNLIAKGYPIVSYTNPTNQAKDVYVVVYYGDLVRPEDSTYKLLINYGQAR